jgi:hypothetical protein
MLLAQIEVCRDEMAMLLPTIQTSRDVSTSRGQVNGHATKTNGGRRSVHSRSCISVIIHVSGAKPLGDSILGRPTIV